MEDYKESEAPLCVPLIKSVDACARVCVCVCALRGCVTKRGVVGSRRRIGIRGEKDGGRLRDGQGGSQVLLRMTQGWGWEGKCPEACSDLRSTAFVCRIHMKRNGEQTIKN